MWQLTDMEKVKCSDLSTLGKAKTENKSGQISEKDFDTNIICQFFSLFKSES